MSQPSHYYHQSTLGRFFQRGTKFSKEALAEKRARVATLLQQNRDNVLFRDPATNLYCDRRQERQRRRGVTSLLRKAFYSHYEFPERRRGRSGLASGSRLHRHLYHRYMCLPVLAERAKKLRKERRKYAEEFKSSHEGREPKRFPKSLSLKEAAVAASQCLCARKYGSKTHDTRLKEDSATYRWLRQADEFLAENSLTPIGCEVIVSCQELTTEVDMLAWREGRRVLCNVSWKTGSNQLAMDSNRRGGMMTAQASHVPNTEHQHAQLQQFVEDRIMRSGHQLEADEHYIVFFGSRTDDASVVIRRESRWRTLRETADPLWSAVCKEGV